MPNTRDLRRRIKSVKNTAQITKAMQMVSATKMRRAQNQAIAGRPYSQTLRNVLALVAGKIEAKEENQLIHPLLGKNQSSKIGVLVFSTDKGLCGALNTNLIRTIQSHEIFSSGRPVEFYSVGRKIRDYIVRTDKVLEADFENEEKVSSLLASKIRKYLVSSFLENKVGEIYVLYPDFVSTLRQEARLVKLLPLDWSVLANFSEPSTKGLDFLVEPDLNEIMDFALTHLMDTIIFQALSETKASEHSARMMAMQNATDNASDLVEDLTLTYNQARQGAITKELLEIASAQAVLG